MAMGTLAIMQLGNNPAYQILLDFLTSVAIPQIADLPNEILEQTVNSFVPNDVVSRFVTDLENRTGCRH